MSHSINDLRTAVEMMDGTIDAPSWTPANFILKRRALVTHWAAIIAAIQSEYDPSFDPSNPNDLPQSCIIPPQQPNGTQLLACTDPAAVADEATRAKYIAAVHENQIKYKTAMHFHDVNLLDMRAMAVLTGSLKFLNRLCTVSSDLTALSAILIRAGITKERRARIEAALQPKAQ